MMVTTTSEIILTRLMVHDNCKITIMQKVKGHIEFKGNQCYSSSNSPVSKSQYYNMWYCRGRKIEPVKPMDAITRSHIDFCKRMSVIIELFWWFRPIGYNKCLVFQMTKNGTRFIKAHIQNEYLHVVKIVFTEIMLVIISGNDFKKFWYTIQNTLIPYGHINTYYDFDRLYGYTK